MNSRFSTCKFLGLLLAAGLVSGQAMAQGPSQTNTASAKASAKILKPITIEKTKEMNFGNVVADQSNGGTVVLATDGTRQATAGASFISDDSGTVSAAEFEVDGEKNAIYSVTLPDDLTLSDDGNTMTVDNFTFSTNGNTELDSDGEQDLKVGGTLNVAANQAPGTYTGYFDVTVNYN